MMRLAFFLCLLIFMIPISANTQPIVGMPGVDSHGSGYSTLRDSAGNSIGSANPMPIAPAPSALPLSTTSPDAPNAYGGSVTSASQIGSTIVTNTYSSIAVQFPSVGTGNVVSAQTSNDNTDWSNETCQETDTPGSGTSFALTGTPSFVCSAVPGTYWRLMVTTYGSGTVTAVIWQRSATLGISGGGSSGPSNSANVPFTDATGVQASYTASESWTMAGAPTDITTFCGNSAYVVKIREIDFSATAGTAVPVTLSLIKRSAHNTGGTNTAIPSTPNDDNNSASPANVFAYTVNPSALGTTEGNLDTRPLNIPLSSAPSSPIVFTPGPNQQAWTLRAASQCIMLNLGGATISGGTAYATFKYTIGGP